MSTDNRFTKSIKSDDGFFSIKKNLNIWLSNTKIATPLAIVTCLAGLSGIMPLFAICLTLLLGFLLWVLFLKHISRFFFTLFNTTQNVDGKWVLTKPYPKCMQIDPNDPYK